jgi:hypothetical protein
MPVSGALPLRPSLALGPANFTLLGALGSNSNQKGLTLSLWNGGRAVKTQMKSPWRTMVGTALLWTAFAALVYAPSSGDGERGMIVAALGFVSFASGLALFADGPKRDIVAQLRREQRD